MGALAGLEEGPLYKFKCTFTMGECVLHVHRLFFDCRHCESHMIMDKQLRTAQKPLTFPTNNTPMQYGQT